MGAMRKPPALFGDLVFSRRPDNSADTLKAGSAYLTFAELGLFQLLRLGSSGGRPLRIRVARHGVLRHRDADDLNFADRVIVEPARLSTRGEDDREIPFTAGHQLVKIKISTLKSLL
jgi:hypothetical protein